MAGKKRDKPTLAETARSHCELCRYYMTVGKPTSLFFKVAAGDNRPRWQEAAEGGSPDAQYLLGSCLRHGYGGPKDIRGSRKLFEDAAAQGHALGQYCLGVACQEGFTGPKDFAEAAAWFKKAADQGLAEAQFALVAMYCKRVPAAGLTPESAMDLLKQAANQGHEAAKAKLEQALKAGGIAQEPPEEANPGKVTLQGVLREMISDHIKAAMTEAILSGGAKDKPTNDLMTAASKNELDTARACIEAGADVNGCTPSGATSLILAAGRGHREMVKFLLDSGADCNVKDGVSEATALHEAAIGDHVEIVRMLVAAGATVDARDDDDRTPLFNGGVAVAEVLVKAGADVNVRSRNGRTVLHGTSDAPLTEFLLKNGADVNAVDKRGRTPLYEAVRDENEAKVRVLLENGASPLAKDADGVTPADLARKSGREGLINLFAASGEAKNSATLRLLSAAGANDLALAKDSLAAGADVNGHGPSGVTPLMLAANKGFKEMVGFLLASGADCNARNSLLDRTALHEAAEGQHAEIARMLLSAGSVVDARDCHGMTPLFQANAAVAEVLVKAGADVNARNKWGWVALRVVSDPEIVELLLKSGANIDAADAEGRTPLHDAVCEKDEAKARLLLENGASSLAKDTEGKTPADLARESGRRSIMRLFSRSGT